jgi:hypothetical protein
MICGATMHAAIKTADQRQHGRVGEMEQHGAAGKDQERAITKEVRNIGWRSFGGRLDYSAMGRVGVDFSRRYAQER